MAEGDMDFSNMDGMDDIDWSDVEAELQQNRDMIQAAAGKKTGGAEAFGELKVEESGGGGEIAGASEVGVDFLLQIPLQLRVEVGTATMLIKDILAINSNSIFELKKFVGEPMDIMINEKQVAKGEIIVQNEKFGIKIVEILDRKARMKSLQT